MTSALPTDVASMMDGMRSTLEADEAGGKLAGLTVEGLQKAMSHPQAQAVIRELMALEATVVREGEAAPDFTLPWLAGSGGSEGASLSRSSHFSRSSHSSHSSHFSLSSHFGERPVALIFGSYT